MFFVSLIYKQTLKNMAQQSKPPNYNTLTKGQLVEAILKLKIELNELKDKVEYINLFLLEQSNNYKQIKK